METPTNKPRKPRPPPPYNANHAAYIASLIAHIEQFKVDYHGGWCKGLASRANTSSPIISKLVSSKFEKPTLLTLFRIGNALGLETRLLTEKQAAMLDATNALVNEP